MADSEATVPTAPSKSFDRKGSGRKRSQGSNQRKHDEHRVAKGDAFEADRRRQIEERTGGFDFDLPLPKLADVCPGIIVQTAQIPISTRGIGFSCAYAYDKAFSAFPQKVVEKCSIYQLYRASLVQAELLLMKDEGRKRNTFSPDPDQRSDADFDKLVCGHRETFTVIANAISSYGWFDYNGLNFLADCAPNPEIRRRQYLSV